MMRLNVLGITGSIGKNVVEVVKIKKDDFSITACGFNNNINEFKKIYHFLPNLKYVYVGDKNIVKEMIDTFPELKIFYGEEGLKELIKKENFDMTVNAFVGFAGLLPSLLTIQNDLDLALANKESLVVGGELIEKELLLHPLSHLYPIDSEHAAISKLLKHQKRENVKNLIITASGGSFRNLTREQLSTVTVQDALNHPSWKMGEKITIDSATMMNKGFEIIEAYYLFHFPLDNIKVLLHDESIIHSAIEMIDHSLVADLGIADMRIPISYALYGENYKDIENVGYLDLETISSLHFRKFSNERYPAIALAKKALKIGKSMPCVLNGANEYVNLAFRKGLIPFDKIEYIIEETMNKHTLINDLDYDTLVKVDAWAKSQAAELILKGL